MNRNDICDQYESDINEIIDAWLPPEGPWATMSPRPPLHGGTSLPFWRYYRRIRLSHYGVRSMSRPLGQSVALAARQDELERRAKQKISMSFASTRVSSGHSM
jgi:hypothetical protein